MMKKQPPQDTLTEFVDSSDAPVTQMPSSSELAIFSSEDGRVRVETRITDGTVWLSQKLMAQLFGVTVSNITQHLKNIFDDGELSPDTTIKEFLTVVSGGRRYRIKFYNLDAIIHVGYRVHSSAGSMFRAWATERLKEYMIKGFTLDDERLKNPQPDDSHYEELLARIRDIRTSEKRFYQKVRDLIAQTSEDYAFRKHEDEVHDFFATIQNKMLYATTGSTAAELIMARARADKQTMGLTSFKGNIVRIGDITVSKNYLTESELVELNELVQMFILFAEDRAKRHIPTHLNDWMAQTDNFLTFYGREILTGRGTRGKTQMEAFVRRQYEQYCERQRKMALEEAEAEYEAEISKAVMENQKTKGRK